MVELRKRPPPKEPAAPPPAAKKRTAKPKAGSSSSAKDEGVAAKAKKAVGKAKKAITGEAQTEEPADAPAPAQSDVAVESGEAGMIPETAGTAPSTITVPVPEGSNAAAAPADDTLPPIAPTGATVTNGEEHDTDRAETNETLENPPENGKAEPATTAAEAAVAGAGVGPAMGATGGAATQQASVPLNAESVGKQIVLEGFGGEVETHTGEKVSVNKLLGQAAAKGGIVIFTYPKASTPGCTQQVCLFRDAYEPITKSGLSVYGLSTDSTKANTTFATKQSLPYPLLCDPSASLTGAIGMKKPPKSTTRGVVVIDGQGVVKVWFQGGPAKTLEVVKAYIETIGK